MIENFQFAEMMISEQENYSIGVERVTGRPYFSVVQSDGLVDHDAHYEISQEEFDRLLADPGCGEAFARRCRSGEEDGRLFGVDRTPV